MCGSLTWAQWALSQHISLAVFLDAFSVIFASFSGLSGALAFTGDVKNPASSYPRGLMLAAVFSACALATRLCVAHEAMQAHCALS